ncbi:predicted protein [Sclerotinia sclerotiorum 1980 UF-70]|uniref:Uncharacterized protein n=1 Tax=Sclerotinia sclerotiorum (strain ATCC 18683 / 1980 / Ss-1) TaxID=665079 RepID=A7EAZ6_SCLS1|nr:predicted protein [Sclerotinia sclerotiorum 1980 UF-70]EDN99624.1 predicted protein [Sclerotinia sclerotiorum 1980 UF-70]
MSTEQMLSIGVSRSSELSVPPTCQKSKNSRSENGGRADLITSERISTRLTLIWVYLVYVIGKVKPPDQKGVQVLMQNLLLKTGTLQSPYYLRSTPYLSLATAEKEVREERVGCYGGYDGIG